MDAATHHVTAALLTDKDALDRHALPALLKRTGAECESVCADGAYDFEQCYRAIKQHGAMALIPPGRDAVIRGKSPFERRDENLRGIRKRGRKQWKRRSGYHQRSLVECAFFRLKTVLSDRPRARRADTQATEAKARCAALNRMTSLGMPQGCAV
jgi:transposase